MYNDRKLSIRQWGRKHLMLIWDRHMEDYYNSQAVY